MEFDKFDKEIFKHIIDGNEPNRANKYNGNRMTKNFSVTKYTYDYRHAIIQYYKQCGCDIRWTAIVHNKLFEVQYTAPYELIEVDIDDFANNYKGGIWLDHSIKWFLWILGIVSIALVLIAIYLEYYM